MLRTKNCRKGPVTARVFFTFSANFSVLVLGTLKTGMLDTNGLNKCNLEKIIYLCELTNPT